VVRKNADTILDYNFRVSWGEF